MKLKSSIDKNKVKKRLKGEDRKKEIIYVAKGLFAQKGFYGVTVDQIVDAIGVSPAILYRYFSSKESLYDAVLNEISCKREDYIAVVLEEFDDYGSILRRMTLLYVKSIEKEQDYLRMELYSGLEGNKAIVNFFENRWKPFMDLIADWLKDEVITGKLTESDVKSMCLLFQGMIREALYAKFIYKSSYYKDISIYDLIRNLLDRFVDIVNCIKKRV
jgi:AcrR family transcriptional regulator